MRKQFFKWTAIVCLFCLSMCCVHAYNLLFPKTAAQDPTVDDTPSTETVVPPVQTPPTPVTPTYTTFPKLPLLSPDSDLSFLQNLGGSGDDLLYKCWVDNAFIYAFGQTESADHDFTSPALSPFLARLSLKGVVEKVVLFSGYTYLSSCLTPNGLALALRTDTATTLHFIDSSLSITHSVEFSEAFTEFNFCLDASGLFALGVSSTNSTLFRFDLLDFSSNSFILPKKCLSTVGFCSILDNIIFLANHGTSFTFYRFDKSLTPLSTHLFSYSDPVVALSCVPSFFSSDLGFALTLRRGDKILFCGITHNGKTVFSTNLSTAQNSYLLRSASGNYLAFCSSDTATCCTILSPQGDVKEQSLALSGFFPVDFVYTYDFLVVLATSVNEKGGYIVRFDSNDSPTFDFSFPSVLPQSLSLTPSGSLVLALSATRTAPSFGSGYGKFDGFVLGLN